MDTWGTSRNSRDNNDTDISNDADTNTDISTNTSTGTLDFSHIGSPDADVHTLLEDVSSGYIRASNRAVGRFSPHLISNTVENRMIDVLERELSDCESFDISVAFLTTEALKSLYQPCLDARRRHPNAHRRIITSTKSYFNRPEAFSWLLKLKTEADVDVLIWHHDSPAASADNPVSPGPASDPTAGSDEPFHPKGYVFLRRTEAGRPYYDVLIGSSNMTERALSSQKEWNLRISSFENGDLVHQLREELAEQIAHSTELTQAWIDQYELEFKQHQPPREQALAEQKKRDSAPVTPNSMQREALARLQELRARGERRAIIISATGTGKTYLSAFDVKNVRPRRMLYLVHQQQILEKSRASYQRVLGCDEKELGLLTGDTKQGDRRYVFATIQTISRDETLNSFAPDAFDYILFDEVHHAGAATYRKVLDHFTGARFVLGMTATPERTDGINIFSLFGNNIAYEIRLQQALDAGLLCPFHYFGVTEYLGCPHEAADGTVTPGASVSISGGKSAQDAAELNATFSFDDLTSRERVHYIASILTRYSDPVQPVTGLVFCSRTDEAERLSRMLDDEWNQQAERRYRTAAVTESTGMKEREELVGRLERGELDYLFSVNVFNEGVDIPSLNQVVMLRNTQSSIVFTQQLGRGLRRFPHKTSVTIIDFIGNYANNYLIPIALFGAAGSKEIARKNTTGMHHPGASSVHFDEISTRRIMESLDHADLSDLKRLRASYTNLRFQLNAIPMLMDFYREDPSLPIALANLTARSGSPDTYLAFVRGCEKSLSRPSGARKHDSPAAHGSEPAADDATEPATILAPTDAWQDAVLKMASSVILPGARPHEAVMLCMMCGFALPEELGDRLPSEALPEGLRLQTTPRQTAPEQSSIPRRGLTRDQLRAGVAALFPDTDLSDDQMDAALRVLDYSVFSSGNRTRFGARPLVTCDEDGAYRLSPDLREALEHNRTFATFLADTLRTSLLICRDAYDELRRTGRRQEHGFLYEHRYSLWEIMRLCCWQQEQTPQNVGGYFVNTASDTMPIMVKYAASQYADRFLGTQDMLWYSKNRRTTQSPEFRWMRGETHDGPAERASQAGRAGRRFIPLFVMRKADSADPKSDKRYFYVGHVSQILSCENTTIPAASNGGTSAGNPAAPVKIVRSVLRLESPLTASLHRYLTDGAD
ncbi:DUF3427 domain-containing protein [Pseudoscardovia radai]|uniref:DUF3427 domain-containing protein n=1 Tax=Pseudoscardovia radai TaxID=987066 RepID=UPI00399600F8